MRARTVHLSRAWLATLLAMVAFETFVLAHPFSGPLFTAVDDLSLTVAGAVAARACWRRSARERSGLSAGWRWLATGCAAFALSMAGFGAQAWRPAAAGSSPADVLSIVAIPLIIVGLARLAGTTSVMGRLVSVMDGLVVALSALFVGWAFVLRTAYRDTTANSWSQAVLLFFVLGSLVLAGLVLILAMHWPGNAATLGLLSVGFCWLSATQISFGVESLRGTYVTGDPLIDIGWVAPLLLIAMAARQQVAEFATESLRRRWVLSLVVPFGSLLLVGGSATALDIRGTSFDGVLQVSAGAIVLLLVMRQIVTLAENQSLTRDLEARVEERTVAVRHAEWRLASLLRNSTDVIALIDERGRLRYASPAVGTVLGYSESAIVGRDFLELAHVEDRSAVAEVLAAVRRNGSSIATHAFRLRCADGSWRPVEATISMLRDDPLTSGLVANIRDVSERTALHEEVLRQATYDALTGLANRRLFHDRVHHALARARRTGEALSVLFVDLDHFKRVNDTAGHAVGDMVLLEVADRLRACLRPADTAARLGGDEFAVLLEGTTAEQASEVATRLVEVLGPVYRLEQGSATVTASVGVTTCVAGKGSSDSLLRDADVAMYQAKAQGRAQFAFFHPRMHTRLVEQMEMENGLRAALESGALHLAYQPLVDLASGAVCGVEALVRWDSGPGGDVPPSLFIPLAEERGLIQALDRWVLRQACCQVRRWQQQFPQQAHLRANVNMSAVELRDPMIADEIALVLAESGLGSDSLTLEITETAVLPDPEHVTEMLRLLRAQGIGISLDDFGTGNASLATLRTFPLDEIKIDRSFVDALGSGASGRRLLKAIVAMADALSLRTVAEAVETEQQLQWLRRLGCKSAQGYLFCAPLSASELERVFSLGGSVLDPVG